MPQAIDQGNRIFLRGLSTAHPPNRYSKQDCWQAFQASAWFKRLDRRSRSIAQRVLTRDNGIESRYLALNSLDECFQIEPNTLHARFQQHAPALADSAAGGHWWMSAFGAGFSCHGALLEVV